MTRKKPELPEGDDGRTIVDMNVEGMPWYSPRGRLSEGNVGDSPVVPRSRNEQGRPLVPAKESTRMTKEESRYYTWGAVKAALLVTGVMCAGIVLFVLFCLYVWFK